MTKDELCRMCLEYSADKDLHGYCLKHDLYKLPSGFEFMDDINE